MNFSKPLFILALVFVFGSLNVHAWLGFLAGAARAIATGVRALRGAVTIGRVATTVTRVATAADLALNIGNVASKGCMYYPSICTLKSQIERLEREGKPVFAELGALERENSDTYGKLTIILQKANTLAQLSNKLQYLVVSIIKKLGSPQQLDDLAMEYERNTNSLMNTFASEMQTYQASMRTKAWAHGVVQGTYLLYSGGKAAYKSLKKAGRLPSTSAFKRISFPRSGVTRFRLPASFSRVGRAFSAGKAFFRRPNVVKFGRYAARGGAVVGSLAGLGLTLAVDITQARKMRDSLRNTHAEMSQTLHDARQHLNEQRESKQTMARIFNEVKTNYTELLNVVNLGLRHQLYVHNMAAMNHQQFITAQESIENKYRQAIADLEKLNLNLDVIAEVRLGVELEDDISRIIRTISRKGFGQFTVAEILIIIAEQFPEMASYKGHVL